LGRRLEHGRYPIFDGRCCRRRPLWLGRRPLAARWEKPARPQRVNHGRLVATGMASQKHAAPLCPVRD
ncbi:MAG: hypothetical protein WAS73_06165, partial [Defluviicoccus sp.]